LQEQKVLSFVFEIIILLKRFTTPLNPSIKLEFLQKIENFTLLQLVECQSTVACLTNCP